MDNIPTLPRRLLAAGIGLFALWQMVFMVSANVMDLVPRDEPEPAGIDLDILQTYGRFTSWDPLQKLADRFGNAVDSYAELTAQEQVWPLFAPGFAPHSTFSAIEVHFADGHSVDLRSDFEPADCNHAPLRLPFFQVRRYNVEYEFLPSVMQHTSEAMTDPEFKSIVRKQTFTYFRHCQPLLICWLKWRAGEYQKAHPEAGTPTEMIYKARYIPGPLPHEKQVWDKPVRERPLVRWQPGRSVPADELPLQIYDTSSNRWITLLKAGGER